MPTIQQSNEIRDVRLSTILFANVISPGKIQIFFYLYEYAYWSKIDLPLSFIVLSTDEHQRMIIAAKTNRISENGHGVQWDHIYSHINIYLNWNHRSAFVYSPSIRVPWTVVIMPLQTSRPQKPHEATTRGHTWFQKRRYSSCPVISKYRPSKRNPPT